MVTIGSRSTLSAGHVATLFLMEIKVREGMDTGSSNTSDLPTPIGVALE